MFGAFVKLITATKEEKEEIVNGREVQHNRSIKVLRGLASLLKVGWHLRGNYLNAAKAVYCAWKDKETKSGFFGKFTKHFALNRRWLEDIIKYESGLDVLWRGHNDYKGVQTRHTAHTDPTRVNDNDAIENLIYELEDIIEYAKQHHNRAGYVYKHAEEIKRFVRERMTRLKEENIILQQYHQIVNAYAEAVGFPERVYNDDGSIAVTTNVYSNEDKKEIIEKLHEYTTRKPRRELSPVIERNTEPLYARFKREISYRCSKWLS